MQKRARYVENMGICENMTICENVKTQEHISTGIHSKLVGRSFLNKKVKTNVPWA